MIINQAQVAAALPGYELGAQLGRGAFGLVLAARHRGLGRAVAVKIVPAGACGLAGEAQLLASLDHPHIVRVYDYAEADDLHLVVMELLGGGTLTHRGGKRMPQEGACAAGLAVAAALACAHAMNVLHRDIKPDNVLFDTTGLPKVTDFGTAKLVEGSVATASGVVGTPLYMAPEQITSGRLGPATDIYALGVLLYEMLAGAPPFDPALGVQALWQHHLDSTPAAPGGVPAPVAQVVLRALAKEPAARQPSAHAFALDLADAAGRAYGPRWTSRSGLLLRLDDDIREAADHPMPARRPAPAPATRTAATRRHGPAAAREDHGRAAPGPRPTLATGAAAAGGGAPLVAQAGAPVAGRNRRRTAEHPAPSPDQARRAGRRTGRAHGDPLRPAQPARVRQVRSLLDRPWLRSLLAVFLVLLAVAAAGVIVIVIAARDEPAASASLPRAVGQPLSGHPNSAWSVAFSPDGATLATAGGDGAVRLWDVADPDQPRPVGDPLTDHTDIVSSVAFSPDGATVATASWDATVRLWDVADRTRPRLLGEPLGHTDTVSSVAFSPDGATVATASRDGAVRLWDLAQRARPRLLGEPLTEHTDDVHSVAFSRDGATLATAGGDGAVRLWDLAQRDRPRLLGEPLTEHTDDVYSVAFSRDGGTLATAGGDGAVRLWDLAQRDRPRLLGEALAGQATAVTSVAFSPGGTLLATGGHDGVVRLWDVADLAAPRPFGPPLEGHTAAVASVAFSPDGTHLASGGHDGAVRLWATG